MSGGRRSPNVPRRLDVLHLILVLGPTNSQFNEHCLPQVHARDISICTYFTPRLVAPAEIALFAGDGTLRGYFRALSRSLDASDHDIVHDHAAPSGFLLMMSLASRPSRWRYWKRTVFTVHDSWYDFRPRSKLLMLPVFATFRRVVFCGESAYESAPTYVKRLIGRRARVVQNAADLDRVDRVLGTSEVQHDDARFTVVAIARLEPVKDPMTLIAAFERSATADSRLVVIGDGSLREEVRRRVDRSPVSAQIELTGLVPREEVFRRCAAADLFVSVSLGEGLPVAAMEAMGAGCPAVLSDIAPHRELVEGTTIPLVRCGDVVGFAAEIERVRRMTVADRRAVGRAARLHVATRFSLERMHAGYGRVYEELRPDIERADREPARPDPAGRAGS
jgi:glycosyltransferase involved in cell wall biosynthesis